MSDLSVAISGFVAGDNLEIRRTITGLTDAIATAWLTVKRHSEELDEDAIISKVITTDDAPGTGQIEQAGGVGTSGILRFDLDQDDTRGLAARSWVLDVQIKLDDGKVYTPELGTIQLSTDVTKATTV